MDTTRNAGIGLCAACRHVRWIRTERGSAFALCTRSTHDPSFARYPRLPVRVCPGYQGDVAVDSETE